jgi:hypothetical protein
VIVLRETISAVVRVLIDLGEWFLCDVCDVSVLIV